MRPQRTKVELFKPGARAVTVDFEPGGGAICQPESKVANKSVAMEHSADDAEAHSTHNHINMQFQLVGGTAMTHEEAYNLRGRLNKFLDPTLSGDETKSRKARNELVRNAAFLCVVSVGCR